MRVKLAWLSQTQPDCMFQISHLAHGKPEDGNEVA